MTGFSVPLRHNKPISTKKWLRSPCSGFSVLYIKITGRPVSIYMGLQVKACYVIGEQETPVSMFKREGDSVSPSRERGYIQPYLPGMDL